MPTSLISFILSLLFIEHHFVCLYTRRCLSVYLYYLSLSLYCLHSVGVLVFQSCLSVCLKICVSVHCSCLSFSRHIDIQRPSISNINTYTAQKKHKYWSFMNFLKAKQNLLR